MVRVGGWSSDVVEGLGLAGGRWWRGWGMLVGLEWVGVWSGSLDLPRQDLPFTQGGCSVHASSGLDVCFSRLPLAGAVNECYTHHAYGSCIPRHAPP